MLLQGSVSPSPQKIHRVFTSVPIDVVNFISVFQETETDIKYERKEDQMKKVISAILAFAMCISLASCSQDSKYSLSNIKLTESERSWKNPETQYAELTKLYGDLTCSGTMVVATDKDTIYLYAEDEKEKDGKTLESQDTVFDLGSISKTFTAVAVLQLTEKGKIKLDDTLDKYFPEYETGKKITIDNLLHMRSGIPDYNNNPDPFWNISGEDAANKKLSDVYFDRISDEEFLKALYQAPLGFEPGTQYEYSNTNYHLLAFIIEKVSGMKYCDYVKKNIFDKCGMKKTTSMATGDLTYVPVNFDDLVKYNFSKDGYPACPNSTRGDSGIHSCLTDMVAFDRALFAGKLLNKNSMEVMFKDVDGYCCGLMKEKDGYSHSGSSFTCETNNRIIESKEFGHIYMISLERTGVVPKFSGEDPMTGTKFTAGTVKDGVYINEYAGLKIKVPDGFTALGEEERKKDQAEALRAASDSKEKTRMQATNFDAWLWDRNTGTSIMVEFMNTRLGFPYDSDYTEEDFLNDDIKKYEELNIIKKEISKVNLGGKEYTRAALTMQNDGRDFFVYLYVRKLDDNLMVEISCGGMGEKSSDYFEKLFG